ncbi:hypothetical protein scyTo_0013768 [Scyliorhinus torazame]|uniref:Uncharacterized protein n=1 Tax=Scyliorhinus torazame TaxID=75743 RepID=A0A401P4H5_SCYTO|nr:hypothetical protein [Scyliorhinus torazame]
MDSQSEHREQELEVQRDSSSLCLSEHFGPIAMLQKPIFFVLLVVATQGENISGCQDGWQEEKELSVNNTPFAILTQDNPLNCIYPCKNLTHQEIWLNCTLINDTLIKYTCTKDKKVYEFTHNFKGKGKYQFGFALLTILNPKVRNIDLWGELYQGGSPGDV